MRHRSLVMIAATLAVCALAAAPAEAQRRHHGHRSHVSVIQHSPLLWGGGFFGAGFYHPPYLAFGQWYPYPYPVFRFPGGHFPDHVVSLRLQVTPREAFVYVDGYAAGTVDDYDGVFQRLRLVPGPHEIVIYHPGHRTLRQNLYYNPGSTHTIRHRLEALAPGEAPEAQPVPRPMPPPGMPPPPGGAAADASGTGTLALRVQPADATVLIDGEPWKGPASQDRLVIQLPEGSHRVEIEKPGFQTFSVDVDVRAGETTSFNVSLIP